MSILSQSLAVKAEEKRIRLEAREAPVWVYVICWQRRGPCKVGVAQDIVHRRIELQVGNPFELAIFSAAGLAETTAAFSIESEIKQRFKGRGLMGEWFQVTALEMTAALRQVVTDRGHDLIDYKGPRTVRGILRKRALRDAKSDRARRAMAEYRKLNAID